MFAANHPVSGLDLQRVARLSNRILGAVKGELAECLVQLGDAQSPTIMLTLRKASQISGFVPDPRTGSSGSMPGCAGGLLRRNQNVLAETVPV